MAPTSTTTFGVPSGNDALTVRYGVARGVFAQAGIHLEVKTVFGGTELARAFAAGEIDIGSLGSPSGLNAMAAGAPLRIIGSGCRRQAHLYLGVHPEIDGYHALRGRRIGVLSLGSCPAWVVHRMLEHHGLDASRDVELVPMHSDYPQVVGRIADGSIDACLATEPNLSIGEERGVLRTWAAAYEADCLPRFQWIVRVATLGLVERDPQLVHAVLDGCARSARLAAAQAEDFAAFVAGYYGADRDAVDRALAREMPRYELDGKLDVEGLQVCLDLLHELGSVPSAMAVEPFISDLAGERSPAA